MADEMEIDTVPRLPEYAAPPVIETVLGVQFNPLRDLKNAHLGAFWKSLDLNEWPTVEDAPPLPLRFEQFTNDSQWASRLQLQLTQDPASRLQIRNQAGDRMIQVQNSRFQLNWLGTTGNAYPRFENVQADFLNCLQRFLNFLEQEKLEEFRANQWEVVYVNHIPRGTVWETTRDWEFFSLLGSGPPDNGLIRTEGFEGEWHFQIPEERGRLHISWELKKKADSKHDPQEYVRLMLTARGPIQPNDQELDAICQGLGIGRVTIVQSFKNLMSPNANRYWGLKHVDHDAE